MISNGGGPAVRGATTRSAPADVRKVFARFWPATKPVRGRLYLSLALVVAAPVLSAATIWLFKVVIDQVVVPHDYRLFPELAGAYLALAVAQGVIRFADQYVSTGASERFVLDLRSRRVSELSREERSALTSLLRELNDILSLPSVAAGQCQPT